MPILTCDTVGEEHVIHPKQTYKHAAYHCTICTTVEPGCSLATWGKPNPNIPRTSIFLLVPRPDKQKLEYQVAAAVTQPPITLQDLGGSSLLAK